MIKVLFDTNIILDVALRRPPFYEDALTLFSLIDRKEIVASVTATTITDIYYISRKERGQAEALHFITDLIEIVDVLGVDRVVITNALGSGMKDFEDAIQVCASELSGIDVIVTRNKNDFVNVRLKIATPEEFLADRK